MTAPLDWSRRLSQPIEIPTVMMLRTLGDVRTLLSRLPADHKRISTWRLVADQLKAAAASGDVDQLAITLRLVRFMERVECR